MKRNQRRVENMSDDRLLNTIAGRSMLYVGLGFLIGFPFAALVKMPVRGHDQVIAVVVLGGLIFTLGTCQWVSDKVVKELKKRLERNKDQPQPAV